MKNKMLIEKAKRKLKALQKRRRDPRYIKTVGKLKWAGLLDVRDVPEYRGQVFLNEALWAAEIEPRIYELLPAIVARRPKLFVFFDLPEDLDRVVKEIKRGRPVNAYQGITSEKYGQWVSLAGRSSGAPKVMKAFRLGPEEMALLKSLSEKTSKSQTQVLSDALRAYHLRVS